MAVTVDFDERLADGGGGFVKYTVTNEDGDATPPKTLYWSLFDREGNIVNGRDAVEISSPSSTGHIVLNKADTLVDGARKKLLRIVIWGTYDSDKQNDQPIAVQGEITIEGFPDYE